MFEKFKARHILAHKGKVVLYFYERPRIPKITISLNFSSTPSSIFRVSSKLKYIVWRRFETPPIWPSSSPFIFFQNFPLFTRFFGQYHFNEIRDKHKNKLMWQSYFFIFRRLKNNFTCFFYK